jgi:hypothetical protein
VSDRRRPPSRGPSSFWYAQHGPGMEVKVLWGTRSQGPQASRKVQVARPGLKEARSGRGGQTNRNRVRGVPSQGERAKDREALAIKGKGRKLGCGAPKVRTLTWGGLASRLKGRHPQRVGRGVSRGRSSGRGAEQGAPSPRKPLTARRAERRGERIDRGSRRRQASGVQAAGASARE